ncbi:cytochrome P450 [Streptomyces pristinaespiralis]|uniref:Cytochrome P450 n=2 Tax=Streptomyces pristinaespiralis TaxID=38300 RepID=B5HIV7_STRE2|nr:cytochrome P450 [Streptomyces pristinaespiralis]ALC18579.1 cytochrome P450 [Streptomyces pristinaespiralis]ALC25386.1 cytochrome P450 [Streptomyces pristinaespiralis]EDY66768.2 cytochrome P450 [Streptomyces pristinaespiralis ATCC 25486]CBW45722.1 putative cytochrome P450 hydroxylase [Streptomyces pristinaespiralis]
MTTTAPRPAAPAPATAGHTAPEPAAAGQADTCPAAAGHAPAFPFDTEPGPPLEVPQEFTRLRDRCPVQRVRLPYGGEGYLVSRYADVKQVLADRRFSRAATVGKDVPRTVREVTAPGHLLAMDPPEHTRLRRLVAAAFTERSIQRRRPRIQQIVDDLVDGLRARAAGGEAVDLVAHFSMPLPMTVICELLGVPPGDRHYFQRVAEVAFSNGAVDPQEMQQVGEAFGTYLTGHIARLRERPGDDLMSQMIAARDEDQDRLTEAELISLAGTLLLAGYETTAAEISNFVYTLLEHDRWSWLVDHPEHLDTAVEELLRYIALGGGDVLPRLATEDIDVGGTVLPEGASVIAAMISANRDGHVFPDPDVLDLERSPNPHVAFGHGPHHCTGAQLARLELRVALASLLRAFPALRLAVPAAQVPWRQGSLVRGPRQLLLRW